MTAQAPSHSASTPLHKIPVTRLKGIGESLAATLARLNLHTVQDLLFHLPLRYQDRTRITPLGALRPNMDAVIEGEIRACDVVYGRRRSLLCMLQDGTGIVALRFYHFSNAQKDKLKPGSRLRCYGEARRGAAGLEIYHPEYSLVGCGPADAHSLEQTLTPVYPTTEGLGQQRLRKLIQQALAVANPGNLAELLEGFVERSPGELGLLDALRLLHAPPRDVNLNQLLEGQHPCQQRLAFEELLAHHLSLLKIRARIQSQRARALQSNHLQAAFLAALPFKPTAAQARVAAEVAQDLERSFPMLRLVQGDVGSGKTLVAALAMLQAVASGSQAALMAPTEILAEQHRRNLAAWFEPFGIHVASLSGRQKAAEKRSNLAQIASGEAQVVIGTHALIQDDVSFAALGLIIIDEQHRFGVQQRLSLRNAQQSDGDELPHQLIMTATPIPRTLAMSAYADLDYSVIDELPPGRTPVETAVISDQRRDQVVARVSEACRQKRQAYWVCTLIEESDLLEAQAAEATAEELSQALPHLRIGLLHGRIKAPEKEAIMTAFKAGEIDLLVATTVIEVGVDVPNASLMIIENPERLGLAQLHQLRGRVGRGSAASHCVLLYSAPLSRTAKARLQVMRSSNDGFVIAEKDLEIRGPGEVLGTRQTGEMQLKVADLQRDAMLLGKVRQLAPALQKQEAQRVNALIQRWLGHSQDYGAV